MSFERKTRQQHRTFIKGPNFKKYLKDEQFEQLILGGLCCEECSSNRYHPECPGRTVQDIKACMQSTTDCINEEKKSGAWDERDEFSQEMWLETEKLHRGIAVSIWQLIGKYLPLGAIEEVTHTREKAKDKNA